MRARRPYNADPTALTTLHSLFTGPNPPVVRVLVGSDEPHGPHVPLGTDGACHAGRYEASIVPAAAPDTVDRLVWRRSRRSGKALGR